MSRLMSDLSPETYVLNPDTSLSAPSRTWRPSALLVPAPPEPRRQAAQPAPDLLARVSGDPADRIVGLDDPQLLVARTHGAPSGDRLGGLRAVASTAGLGG